MEAVRLGEAGPGHRVAEADTALAEQARGGDAADIGATAYPLPVEVKVDDAAGPARPR